MKLIDSHVNLHAPQFSEDQAQVIARAREAGVGLMLTICDRLENFAAVRALAHAHPDIYASVGAHPHNAKDHLDLTAETLIELAQDPRVVGVGECGLDLHYNYSPREAQLAVFRAHIAAARATGLPLIIHTREADELMAETLEEEMGKGAFPLLLHCYTSGPELARRALALGAYFSFSGILTFKNAHGVRAIAAELPIDRVIVETDCPYLAPIPHRGQRCEPAHVADVLAFYAGMRGVSIEAARQATGAAFFKLFNKIPRPDWALP